MFFQAYLVLDLLKKTSPLTNTCANDCASASTVLATKLSANGLKI